MGKLVKLKALRLIWMGDDAPLVQVGEAFETNADAAKLLVEKGHAERVKVRRRPKKQAEEE